jgi:hypothetical protein
MGAAGVTDPSYNNTSLIRASNSFVTFSRARQESSRFFAQRFCLRSFEAPAQYRRPDIESHGVSYHSVSTLK